MMTPALQYLTLRALGAPAVLLSLAMQGVFRGFKDTKTPLYATGIHKEKLKERFLNHLFFLEPLNYLILTFSPFLCFSGRRCNKHYSRPNIYFHFSFRRQWCSHCTCYVAVSIMLYADSTIFHRLLFYHDIRGFATYCFTFFFPFCRYLIALILFWRLMGQVNLLPPSIKHLQFSRFLKNGKGRDMCTCTVNHAVNTYFLATKS